MESGQEPTLTATYTNLTDWSPLVAFAGITRRSKPPYAGRIARDADGTITGVDARPFNAAHEDRGSASGCRIRAISAADRGHRCRARRVWRRAQLGASGTMLQFSLVDTIRLWIN
jgi:hypothetical protein